MCAVFRRSWSLNSAGIDAVLAIAVAVIAAFLFSAIADRLGALRSLVLPIWGVAVASVVARRLLSRR